jgi:hypothetical protein
MVVPVETSSNPPDLYEDAEGRRRRQRRLYFIFQAAGWGLLFIPSWLISIRQLPDLKPYAYPKVHPVQWAAGFVFPMVVGFLLTHFVRGFMTRWGWKTLGWRSLMPRILLTSAVLSFFWLSLVSAFNYWQLGCPELGFKSPLGFSVQWVGVFFICDGWLCAYFFYHLFDRLNRLDHERLRLVASEKEAALRSLKAQVNPHFLFNSLNCLRELIKADPARADLAVSQLANILRYSLQSSQLATVSLAEELRVAHDYLALEQVRYEDRLRVRIDVAPETLPLAVPPLLLQTLVENAVKYGIAQRPEGGEIAIIARQDAGMLRLEVTNARPSDGSSNVRVESTGLGLRNAAERLRLLFGERATLRLRTDNPALVIAEAVMPLKPLSL